MFFGGGKMRDNNNAIIQGEMRIHRHLCSLLDFMSIYTGVRTSGDAGGTVVFADRKVGS